MSLRDTPLEHLPHRLDTTVGSFRCRELPVTQDFNRVGIHLCERKVLKEPLRVRRDRLVERSFQNLSTDALRACIEALVIGALGKVSHAQPSPCAGERGARTVTGLKFDALRGFVRGHKSWRPRLAAQADLRSAFRTIINANVTVAVAVL
jgi:hypothetical protein